MFDVTNTPTVSYLMAAGIQVEIEHQRRHGKRLMSRKDLTDRAIREMKLMKQLLGDRSLTHKNISKAVKALDRQLPRLDMSPKGGRTTCEIVMPVEGGQTRSFIGIAVCDDQDHYIKEEGRWRAIARALEAWAKSQNYTFADVIKTLMVMQAEQRQKKQDAKQVEAAVGN